MILTDYQALIIILSAIMHFTIAGIILFACWAIVRFKGSRDALAEAIQDGDKVYHWKDAERFVLLVAGCFSAVFTMDIVTIILFALLFNPYSIAIILIFCAVTFNLFNKAWKKPQIL
jgi:hypothetical protein